MIQMGQNIHNMVKKSGPVVKSVLKVHVVYTSLCSFFFFFFINIEFLMTKLKKKKKGGGITENPLNVLEINKF